MGARRHAHEEEGLASPGRGKNTTVLVQTQTPLVSICCASVVQHAVQPQQVVYTAVQQVAQFGVQEAYSKSKLGPNSTTWICCRFVGQQVVQQVVVVGLRFCGLCVVKLVADWQQTFHLLWICCTSYRTTNPQQIEASRECALQSSHRS